MASNMFGIGKGQATTMCLLCWKNPERPPHLHDPKLTIPKTKDKLIDAINEIVSIEKIHTYTVQELKHMYSLMIGKKAHPACPLVGMAQLCKADLVILCNQHGITLGAGKFKKADYCLALRDHWGKQCELGSLHRMKPTAKGDGTGNDDDTWSVVADDDDNDDAGNAHPSSSTTPTPLQSKSRGCVTRVIVELQQPGQSSG